MTDAYRIRRATVEDTPAILRLIASAAEWLQETKHTDQWARPWPNREARDARVAGAIQQGLTWMVEDQGAGVATITLREEGNDRLWTPEQLHDPAVYVSRLIVARHYAGRGLGAALIDWAGIRGIEAWGADWIRVDVWTTDTALHDYYKSQGFEHLCTREFDDPWEYPSVALFQKGTAEVDRAAVAWFTESG